MSGSMPTLARPSVMRMIELLSVTQESVLLARRSASPIAVPESHGRSWRMVYGSIPEMMELMPVVSLENGIETSARPANTIIPNTSSLRSVRNVLIVSLAASIRLGAISSASMERDISRTMRILCFSCWRYSPVLYSPIPMMIPMTAVTTENLSIQSERIRRGTLLYFLKSGFGTIYPIRSRKNNHQRAVSTSEMPARRRYNVGKI